MLSNEEKRASVSRILYIENNYGKIDKKSDAFQMNVKYETEPLRGEGIYSVMIKNKKLPFWIYGRNIVLIGTKLMLVEGVAYNTFSPIFSVLIDEENGKYANLNEWCIDINFTKDGMALDNRFKKVKKQIVNAFQDLEWFNL